MIRSYTNADDTAVIEIDGDVAAAAARLDDELEVHLPAITIREP